jgi:hypothetical protein
MIDYGSFIEKLDFTFGWVHIYVDVGRRNLELEVDKRMLCLTAASSKEQAAAGQPMIYVNETDIRNPAAVENGSEIK